MTDGEPLLSVRDLKKHYPITEGILSREVGRVRAVDGISFDIARGETLGLVGESGCGKSTAASSIIQLEEPTEGEVIFNSEKYDPVADPSADPHPNDVTEFDDRQLKEFRRQAQMIYQDPSSSFDPRMTIGESVAEPLRVHGLDDKERRKAIVEDLLERVGLSADDYHRYPHEFSGGQKQRVGLARALVLNPELIIADEPVSALDVSVQAEVLSLMNDIKEEFGLSMLFISHDLGVVREVCDRVAVMYLGEIVELGPTEQLFENPQHPYTQALLSSIPVPDPRQRGMGVELSGDVPSPSNPPSGCRFHTRCPKVIQPEGYDFEQEHWRSVMELRDRIGKHEIDVEAVREYVVGEHDGDIDEEAVTADQMDAVIRDEFDVPDPLPDADAEAVLAEGLEHVAAGDFESADDLLSTEFETVCETRKPTYTETQPGHKASCLLHEAETGDEFEQSASLSD
ncbi:MULTISPECIES: ABC transporter ATP-binding protein [Halorussus]|uniref:ABC transporter ATP-binding protein n=1 Tax=Halorussus TaxID=1070314 RepID=UPI000E214C51|nr:MULTISPECIES: oligopeptide/dipeptide ABC transporter ATP-binding protein [Halorussus]NHN58341.1 ABC transporter ATP-binding protein [Halorussus sp. JP-T4]